jgi:hypothetical protein
MVVIGQKDPRAVAQDLAERGKQQVIEQEKREQRIEPRKSRDGEFTRRARPQVSEIAGINVVNDEAAQGEEERHAGWREVITQSEGGVARRGQVGNHDAGGGDEAQARQGVQAVRPPIARALRRACVADRLRAAFVVAKRWRLTGHPVRVPPVGCVPLLALVRMS